MTAHPVGKKNVEKLIKRLHPILSNDATGIYASILASVTDMPEQTFTKKGIFFLTENSAINDAMVKRISDTVEHVKNVEKIVVTVMSLRDPELIRNSKNLTPFKKEIALFAVSDIDFQGYDEMIGQLPENKRESFIRKFYGKTVEKVMELYINHATIREKESHEEEIENKTGVPMKAIKRHAGKEFASILKKTLEKNPDTMLEDEMIETCRRVSKEESRLDRETRRKIYWDAVYFHIQTKKCIAALAEEYLIPHCKLNPSIEKNMVDAKEADEQAMQNLVRNCEIADTKRWMKPWKKENGSVLQTVKGTIPNLGARFIKYSALKKMKDGLVGVTIDKNFVSVIYPRIKNVIRQRALLREQFLKGRGSYAN